MLALAGIALPMSICETNGWQLWLFIPLGIAFGTAAFFLFRPRTTQFVASLVYEYWLLCTELREEARTKALN